MFTDAFTGTVYSGKTITHEVDGFILTATVHADDTMRCPWDDDCGHGEVSDWTRRDKRPGERVLCTDSRGGSKRYYDVQASTAIAKRDGWGPRLPYRTAGQSRAAAVEADYQFLRSWCENEWQYVGVAVTVSRNGIDLTDEYDHALWGIESMCADHITDTARELCEDALAAARQTLAELVA